MSLSDEQVSPLDSLRFAKRIDGSEVALTSYHWQGKHLPAETQTHVYIQRRRDDEQEGGYSYYCTLMEMHEHEMTGNQAKFKVSAGILKPLYNLSSRIPVTGDILGPMKAEEVEIFMNFAFSLSALRGARYLKLHDIQDFGAPVVREVEAKMRLSNLTNKLSRPYRPKEAVTEGGLVPLGSGTGAVLTLHHA